MLAIPAVAVGVIAALFAAAAPSDAVVPPPSTTTPHLVDRRCPRRDRAATDDGRPAAATAPRPTSTAPARPTTTAPRATTTPAPAPQRHNRHPPRPAPRHRRRQPPASAAARPAEPRRRAAGAGSRHRAGTVAAVRSRRHRRLLHRGDERGHQRPVRGRPRHQRRAHAAAGRATRSTTSPIPRTASSSRSPTTSAPSCTRPTSATPDRTRSPTRCTRVPRWPTRPRPTSTSPTDARRSPSPTSTRRRSRPRSPRRRRVCWPTTRSCASRTSPPSSSPPSHGDVTVAGDGVVRVHAGPRVLGQRRVLLRDPRRQPGGDRHERRHGRRRQAAVRRRRRRLLDDGGHAADRRRPRCARQRLPVPRLHRPAGRPAAHRRDRHPAARRLVRLHPRPGVRRPGHVHLRPPGVRHHHVRRRRPRHADRRDRRDRNPGDDRTRRRNHRTRRHHARPRRPSPPRRRHSPWPRRPPRPARRRPPQPPPPTTATVHGPATPPTSAPISALPGRHLQRRAEPQPRPASWPTTWRLPTISRRPTSPRSSSARVPTCCCSPTSTSTGAAAVDVFRTNYLLLSQNGAQPIDYPYVFIAPSNTGVPSGFDLDNDGTVGGANDAFGYGDFPGQHGMVLLSRFPIVDQPGAHVPAPAVGLGAGCPLARRPGDARAGRLVLARRAGGAAALVDVALGRPDRRRRPHRPRPGLAPDAADGRRAGGPQRDAQRRRDRVLGRLRRRHRHRLDRR